MVLGIDLQIDYRTKEIVLKSTLIYDTEIFISQWGGYEQLNTLLRNLAN